MDSFTLSFTCSTTWLGRTLAVCKTETRMNEERNQLAKWNEFGQHYYAMCRGRISHDCPKEVNLKCAVDEWPEWDLCPSCKIAMDIDSECDGGEYDIYVAGVCMNNISSDTPPAGWAFVVVDAIEEKIIENELDRVIVCRDDEGFKGAERYSPSTAELSAIHHALSYIGENSKPSDNITIYYNSEYACKSVQGVLNGSRNMELINACRILLEAIDVNKLDWKHVRPVDDNPHYTLAEDLARDGANKCYIQTHEKPVKKRKT